MTTSPEALREAVARLTSEADNPTGWKWDLSEPEGIRHDTSVARCSDLRTLLSALQKAREALGPFADAASQFRPDDADTMRPATVQALHFRRAAEVYRALSAPTSE